MIGAWLIAILVVFAPAAAMAATITVGPTGCTAAAVNGAISSAGDGDTILLTCTGTQTWTSTVTIPDTKGITLQVQGGTNTPKASASFPLTISSSADPIITVNLENGRSVTRITGFKFTNTISSTKGAIFIRGRGTGSGGIGGFRVDNNYFDSVQLPYADLEGTITVGGRGGSVTGIITGLIDNNTFHNTSYTDGYAIGLAELFRYPLTTSFDYSGGHAWLGRALGWGTSDFIFVEDNLFEDIERYTRHFIAAFMGAKYVARFNTFDSNQTYLGGGNDQVDAHGYCHAGIGHGVRGGEIYSNIFKGSQIGRELIIRGGAWAIYNNIFLNGSPNIVLFEYRADSSTCQQCASSQAGASGWVGCAASNGGDYPLQEQIGRDWNRNAEPTCIWNNLLSGVNQTPSVYSSSMQIYLQSGRDYFTGTTKPAACSSYASYPYPHPLRTGGTAGAPPNPPPILTVQ